MRRNIYAYTEPSGTLPGYVSINVQFFPEDVDCEDVTSKFV